MQLLIHTEEPQSQSCGLYIANWHHFINVYMLSVRVRTINL